MSFDPKKGSGTASAMFAKIFGNLPRTKTVRGDVYVATVFKILSEDALGRPKSIEAIYDEETVHLEGGEKFLVSYVLKSCVEPKTGASA